MYLVFIGTGGKDVRGRRRHVLEFALNLRRRHVPADDPGVEAGRVEQFAIRREPAPGHVVLVALETLFQLEIIELPHFSLKHNLNRREY